jgi:hypothetical protein
MERVTVTLAEELVEAIDRFERNRSRFIATAIRHEIDRLHREALLESVRSPHPETLESAEARLTDWVADLPDEEGLVDEAAGVSVRWIEGKGWVEDPA